MGKIPRAVVPLLVGLLFATPGEQPVVSRPAPTAETAPVSSKGDAADDPSIWVHPTDPDKSLVLGTDKLGGLCVYDLDGKLVEVVGEGLRPNNVDVLYDFDTPEGKVDLAVASLRHPKTPGVKMWRFDRDTGRLIELRGILPVFGGAEPYGICTYRSPKTGKSYVIVNHKRGLFEQYELDLAKGGKMLARLVRKFQVKSQPEGCVADHELGHLYVGEEEVGVWKLPAEPDAAARMKLIARVGENGLKAHVEGLTIYYASGGKGYLIVSSQGNDTFKIYRREGDNAFVGTIDPVAGKFGKVSDTDGIAVMSAPLGKRFPQGLFVAQDGKKRGKTKSNQNFKFYAWQDVAGDVLTIDTSWSPRGSGR